MTDFKEIPNPYLPITEDEVIALRRFRIEAEAYISCQASFSAGLQTRVKDFTLSEETVDELWSRFVESDMKLDRPYPESADAFVAGYRAGFEFSWC